MPKHAKYFVVISVIFSLLVVAVSLSSYLIIFLPRHESVTFKNELDTLFLNNTRYCSNDSINHISQIDDDEGKAKITFITSHFDRDENKCYAIYETALFTYGTKLSGFFNFTLLDVYANEVLDLCLYSLDSSGTFSDYGNCKQTFNDRVTKIFGEPVDIKNLPRF